MLWPQQILVQCLQVCHGEDHGALGADAGPVQQVKDQVQQAKVVLLNLSQHTLNFIIDVD